MNTRFSSLLVLLSALFVMTSLPAMAQAKNATPPPIQQSPQSFADLAEHLLPSVVNISSTQKIEQDETGNFHDMPQFPEGSPFNEFFEEFMDQQHGHSLPVLPQSSLGSGFIIDADKGYIVTNSHVIKGAEEVRVTFHDDSTVEAEIIGRDEKTDLAVLKVKTDKKLSAISFGDSDRLRVGDWVLAIGNPFGLGGTVTAGIVSAQQRNINAGPYDDFIQTDASINRGNSGGPMFNLAGEIIGINTAIFSPSGGSVGIGFAIPANLAKPVINQLIEYGHTRRGWLGVRIQSVTDEIAESLGLKDAQGALVASVTPDGPASETDLKTGDIILSFDGKPIEEMRQLPRMVAETGIGKKVKLVYWRDGKKRETAVKIGELEKAEENGLIAAEDAPAEVKQEEKRETVKFDDLGFSVEELTNATRQLHELSDDQTGLMISDVADLSEAAEKGLLPGDLIIEINQSAVTTPKDAQNAIGKARKDKRSSVLLLVDRDGDVRFIALRLKK